MPKSIKQKRLEALERRKQNATYWSRHLAQTAHYPRDQYAVVIFQDIFDKAAADVHNLRRKLGIPEANQ